MAPVHSAKWGHCEKCPRRGCAENKPAFTIFTNARPNGPTNQQQKGHITQDSDVRLSSALLAHYLQLRLILGQREIIHSDVVPPASIFNCRVKIKQQIWMSLCVQGHHKTLVSSELKPKQNWCDDVRGRKWGQVWVHPSRRGVESFLPFLWRTALFYSQRWKELRISAWFLFGRERRFKDPFDE